MRFSKSFEIKDSICETDRLIDLVKFMEGIMKKSKGYKSLDVKIEKKDNNVISCDNLDEFRDTLQQSISSITGINFSYWGEAQRIGIRVFKWSRSIGVDLFSNKEEEVLKNEKFIKGIFSERSWNSYSIFAFLTLYFFLVIPGLIFLVVKYEFDKGLISGLAYLSLIPLLFLFDKIPSFYPALVLVHNDKKSGRLLKKDMWFLILTLIMPFLLNKL